MKTIVAMLALLFLLSACATTQDTESSDPKMTYGGSFRVRSTVSDNVH